MRVLVHAWCHELRGAPNAFPAVPVVFLGRFCSSAPDLMEWRSQEEQIARPFERLL